MSDDLITSLRALAAARHDDLSIAVDAVIEIERLRAETEALHAALWLHIIIPTNHIEMLRRNGIKLEEVNGYYR